MPHHDSNISRPISRKDESSLHVSTTKMLPLLPLLLSHTTAEETTHYYHPYSCHLPIFFPDVPQSMISLCVTYLTLRANQSCQLMPYLMYTPFCEVGPVNIMGASTFGKGSNESVACGAVATALQRVVDNCCVDDLCQGAAAVDGTEGMVVVVG